MRRFRVKIPSEEVFARHCIVYEPRDLYHRPEKLLSITAENIFGDARPLYLDLGSGRGETMLALAETYPDAGIIGIERHWKSTHDTINKIEASGLHNMKLIRADLRWVFNVIPDGAMHEIFLLFPPPRLEDTRVKDDLLNTQRMHDIHRALVDAGRFYFVTDNDDYFAQRVAQVNASGLFRLELQAEEIEGGQTAFQRRWEKYGITSKRAEFTKI